MAASSAHHMETSMTPFLALVLAGYAAFMMVLAATWLRGALADLRAPKR